MNFHSDHSKNLLWRTFLSLILMFFSISCAQKKKKNFEYKQFVKTDPKSLQRQSREKLLDGEPPKNSKIQSGYLFSISHPNDVDLKGKFRVDWNGNLNLPYRVKIKATGLGFKELQKKVINRYKKFFSKDAPNVQLKLAQRRYYVSVEGLVRKPGKYLLKTDSTLDELIYLAGGLIEKNQKMMSITIKQNEKQDLKIPLEEYYQVGSADQIPYWLGQDQVFITKSGLINQVQSNVVMLTGEVRSPKEVPYENDAGIYYYLTQAGGFTNTSDLEKVELLRGLGSEQKSYIFNMHERESIPLIFPGDQLVVHTNRPDYWERVLDKLVDVASIVSAIAFMIIAL